VPPVPFMVSSVDRFLRCLRIRRLRCSATAPCKRVRRIFVLLFSPRFAVAPWEPLPLCPQCDRVNLFRRARRLAVTAV
jgi:hypothetical protein